MTIAGGQGDVMSTELVRRRLPIQAERNLGSEIVFIRKDNFGKYYKVLARRSHESWEQWGAPTEVLSDNVPDVEKWRKNYGSRSNIAAILNKRDARGNK